MITLVSSKGVTMCGKSHHQLGEYLVEHYMIHESNRNIHAFLFGCIQPDKNPATYFKGSLRCQWLRGHNYHNAIKFMKRISLRLECKEQFTLYDYYTLGKLIHYTADAFTMAHNAYFPLDLACHREYEIKLQDHFLQFLQEDPQVDIQLAKSIMDTISNYHHEYSRQKPHMNNDIIYAVRASCSVLSYLFPQQSP